MTTAARIQVATDYGLQNAEHIAAAATETGVPMRWAFALIEQESMGRNVYGNDVGGALSGFPHEVNKHNYRVFRWLVFEKGMKSNGVGPAQITYRTYHESEDDELWDPLKNIRRGLTIFADWRIPHERSWFAAAGHFNGGNVPNMTYADEVRDKARAWRQRWREAGA